MKSADIGVGATRAFVAIGAMTAVARVLREVTAGVRVNDPGQDEVTLPLEVGETLATFLDACCDRLKGQTDHQTLTSAAPERVPSRHTSDDDISAGAELEGVLVSGHAGDLVWLQRAISELQARLDDIAKAYVERKWEETAFWESL